jgi:hypothetical protein
MQKRAYEIMNMLMDSDTHFVIYNFPDDDNSISIDMISEDEFLTHHAL